MDFGLFYYCQGRGVPHAQAYAEMLDQIALAETLGFGECWFAEHHFTDYSLLPSPNLMIAAAIQRTERMRFGNYVNVLPFHHPLRLAAEAATLDNLARGRFDFGIGKGVRPGEFTKLGLSFDEAPEMTEEAIEILRLTSTREQASYDGMYNHFREVTIRPRPLQQPFPIWISNTGSGGTSPPHAAMRPGTPLSAATRISRSWGLARVSAAAPVPARPPASRRSPPPVDRSPAMRSAPWTESPRR